MVQIDALVSLGTIAVAVVTVAIMAIGCLGVLGVVKLSRDDCGRLRLAAGSSLDGRCGSCRHPVLLHPIHAFHEAHPVHLAASHRRHHV